MGKLRYLLGFNCSDCMLLTFLGLYRFTMFVLVFLSCFGEPCGFGFGVVLLSLVLSFPFMWGDFAFGKRLFWF